MEGRGRMGWNGREGKDLPAGREGRDGGFLVVEGRSREREAATPVVNSRSTSFSTIPGAPSLPTARQLLVIVPALFGWVWGWDTQGGNNGRGSGVWVKYWLVVPVQNVVLPLTFFRGERVHWSGEKGILLSIGYKTARRGHGWGGES